MIKKFNINNTADYHRYEIDSLEWELTVCNLMENRNSPVHSIVNNSDTFGNLLIKLINKFSNLKQFNKILEIGGGYGYLMRDILNKYSHLKAVMLDISPYLLKKQKETLKNFQVSFIERDFFHTGNKFISQFDAAFLNENAGDFETIFGLDPNLFKDDSSVYTQNIRKMIERYKLKFIKNDKIVLNIGAIIAVEKLCMAGLKLIYISEHSCEAEPKGELEEYLDIKALGIPEKIELKGHSEYTIKFSHLVSVAKKFDYSIKRGKFSDIIQLKNYDEIKTILRAGLNFDRHEIIKQFVYDLYKYEYLILTR